jgi:hypothetical protein
VRHARPLEVRLAQALGGQHTQRARPRRTQQLAPRRVTQTRGRRRLELEHGEIILERVSDDEVRAGEQRGDARLNDVERQRAVGRVEVGALDARKLGRIVGHVLVRNRDVQIEQHVQAAVDDRDACECARAKDLHHFGVECDRAVAAGGGRGRGRREGEGWGWGWRRPRGAGLLVIPAVGAALGWPNGLGE